MNLVGEYLQFSRVQYISPENETCIVSDNYLSEVVPKMIGTYPASSTISAQSTEGKGSTFSFTLPYNNNQPS